MSYSDLDTKLENFLEDLKSEPVDSWIFEPLNDLTREGVSEAKLLDLIKEELGEDIHSKVKTLLESSSTDAPEAPGSPDELVGIGGWMILPLIGLFLTPLFAGKALLVDVAPMFEAGVWDGLTVPGGSFYHPAWAPIGYATVTANIVLILASITLIYFMFRKLAIFPKGMVVYYVFIFMASLVEFLVMHFILADAFPNIRMELQGGLTQSLIRSLIGIVIWVPYFMMSDRVKNTFVN